MRELVPYIGICDFMNFDQVQEMLNVFRSNLPDGMNRKLMVGALMSYKTRNDVPAERAYVFPHKNDIDGIFGSDDTFNCLHYQFDAVTGIGCDQEIALAISPYGGSGIHAIQLNRTFWPVWPTPAQIANGIHISRHNVEVILQLTDSNLINVGYRPDELVTKLEDYEGIIHRILFYKKMGLGRVFNPDELSPFIRAVKADLPWLGVGVAGGLGPGTLEIIQPLVEEFPDLSIDAQLRLSGTSKELIDWEMAKRYLIGALKVFAPKVVA